MLATSCPGHPCQAGRLSRAASSAGTQPADASRGTWQPPLRAHPSPCQPPHRRHPRWPPLSRRSRPRWPGCPRRCWRPRCSPARPRCPRARTLRRLRSRARCLVSRQGRPAAQAQGMRCCTRPVCRRGQGGSPPRRQHLGQRTGQWGGVAGVSTHSQLHRMPAPLAAAGWNTAGRAGGWGLGPPSMSLLSPPLSPASWLRKSQPPLSTKPSGSCHPPPASGPARARQHQQQPPLRQTRPPGSWYSCSQAEPWACPARLRSGWPGRPRP